MATTSDTTMSSTAMSHTTMSNQNAMSPTRTGRGRALRAAAAALAALPLVVGPPALADDDFAGNVLECRALASAEARLACYDRVVDGYDAPEAAAAPAAPKSLSADGASETAAAADDRDAESFFGLPPQADPRDTLERIEATVVELTPLGSGKIAIALDNGHVWRQTSSSSLRLSVGDTVVVERASFGSHKLSKPGTNRSMRVRRVE